MLHESLQVIVPFHIWVLLSIQIFFFYLRRKGFQFQLGFYLVLYIFRFCHFIDMWFVVIYNIMTHVVHMLCTFTP